MIPVPPELVALLPLLLALDPFDPLLLAPPPLPPSPRSSEEVEEQAASATSSPRTQVAASGVE